MTPTFGATVTHLLREPGEDRRVGYFIGAVQVRRSNRTGRTAGRWWRLTDGAGDFWEIHPTVGCAALHPPRFNAVEVDESTGLPALEPIMKT